MSVSVSKSSSIRQIGRALVVLLVVASLGACTSEKSRLEAAAKTAATNRAAAATALRNAFFARQITANGAIDMAYARVDGAMAAAGGTQPARTPTAADVAFAGAVLDFIAQTEPDIDQKVANDFFWIRVGTLAGNAAAAAKAMGNTQLAADLVLAGPPRWQNDAYWRQCPAHDALASLLLFETDKGKEALDRLRDRPDLPDEVAQAKAMIEKEMKKRPRR
jgi:hypothetical protein